MRRQQIKDARHDLVCAPAQRFGLTDLTFSMTGLELADATLRASGYPSAQELAARRWVDVQLPFQKAHFLDGFGHPDKSFHFRARSATWGGRLPPLPDWVPLTDQAIEERPSSSRDAAALAGSLRKVSQPLRAGASGNA